MKGRALFDEMTPEVEACMKQVVASGFLINSHMTVVDGANHYDFTYAGIFWFAASIISFILPLLNRRRWQEDDD